MKTQMIQSKSKMIRGSLSKDSIKTAVFPSIPPERPDTPEPGTPISPPTPATPSIPPEKPATPENLKVPSPLGGRYAFHIRRYYQPITKTVVPIMFL